MTAILVLLAASCLSGAIAMRVDLDRFEEQFVIRSNAYEREVAHRFGVIDAGMQSFVGLAEVAGMDSYRANLADNLLRTYPFVSAIVEFSASEVGAPTSLRIDSIRAARNEAASDLGLTPEQDPRAVEAAELAVLHEGLALSTAIERPDQTSALLALIATYADGGRSDALNVRLERFSGAVALYVENNHLFASRQHKFDHVSVWLADWDSSRGIPRPLFESGSHPNASGSGHLLETFDEAIRLEMAGRSLWIATHAQPNLSDLNGQRIALAASAPWAFGVLALGGLIRHRRTRRQVAEFAGRLSASESRFKDFTDASADWYWEMDDGLRFSYFSDRFTLITGVEPEMLLGKTRRDTGIPNVDQAVWDEHLRALDAHEPFRDFIHPRTMQDGAVVWLAINGKPIFDHAGKFIGYRGTGRDITTPVERERQLANAKRQAEAANRTKSELLANMSHEFRTPLNAVIGFAQLLKTDASASEAERVDYASNIETSGQNLLNLVNDLLDLAKIEAGTDKVREELLDIGNLVRSTEKLFEERVIAAHVKSLAEWPHDDTRKLMADRRKVLRILANLMSNAIKFTEAGGQVQLTARFDKEGACLFQVADTGIGMATEDIPKAFATFSQVDTALSRDFDGAGLGLSLTKLLAEQHGGAISIESEPGVGTVVTVRFPPDRTRESAPGRMSVQSGTPGRAA